MCKAAGRAPNEAARPELLVEAESAAALLVRSAAACWRPQGSGAINTNINYTHVEASGQFPRALEEETANAKNKAECEQPLDLVLLEPLAQILL